MKVVIGQRSTDPGLLVTGDDATIGIRVQQQGNYPALDVADANGKERWAVSAAGEGQLQYDDWHIATLASGVTLFNSGYGPVRYRRDAGGVVQLSGIAAHAFATAYPGKAVFTLPDGYRPSYELFMPVLSNSLTVQLAINVGSKGVVAVCNGATWAAFDGMSFVAEIFATIVCLGDSITNGFGSTVAWPAQLQTFLGTRAKVIAKGVNGNTLAQCEARRTTDVDPYTPTYAVIEAGINNVIADGSTASIQAAFTTTANAYISSGYIPIVCTLPPWKNYTSYTSGREVIRKAVNAWLRTQTQWRVVDVEAVLGDGGVNPALQAAYDSGDGLHPNNAGTLVYGQAVFAQAFSSLTI